MEKVLASCDRGTPIGRRDYAILLLLARLGLRAGEVARLQLGDVEWRSGEIHVLGKGRVRDRLPLLRDVGEALVEDNFDELERVWDERYERQHGFWRPIIRQVVEQYMDCGDLRCGFARVRCSACRSEYLLAFSCKRRYFCPSCHQKRVVLFAEPVEQEVLEKVPVRQYLVTIPQMLRIFFKHNRKLLGLLSQCFYQTVKQCLREVSADKRAVPGMIASIQTYGDDLGPFHPHLHCLVSDALFLADGSFFPISVPDPQTLMSAFRHRLLKVLLSREIISSRIVELLLSWRHPGFSVYQGESVPPEDTAARERLARYILHAPFSQERLSYDRAQQTVAWESKKKDGGTTVFSALDWLAALVTHIPDKGQQLVRCYGRYSNVCQGRKKRTTARALQPDHLRADGEDAQFRKQCRQNWARLIKKIFEVDPLLCSCGAEMKIVAFIIDPRVVDRILRHLGSEGCKSRDPFEPRGPPAAASASPT